MTNGFFFVIIVIFVFIVTGFAVSASRSLHKLNEG
jgi:hypothetical protein